MACHKNETRDLGRLQVGPREPGTGTPKCLGGTWDPKPQSIQVGPGTWDPQSRTQDPEPQKIQVRPGTRDLGALNRTWNPRPQNI